MKLLLVELALLSFKVVLQTFLELVYGCCSVFHLTSFVFIFHGLNITLNIVDNTLAKSCEFLEDFCGRAEIVDDDRDESEWLALPLTDLRMLVNEIMSIRSKKLLHLVPLDKLTRLLKVLDNQIHRAEGLSVEECEHVSYLFLNGFVIHILNWCSFPFS